VDLLLKCALSRLLFLLRWLFLGLLPVLLRLLFGLEHLIVFPTFEFLVDVSQHLVNYFFVWRYQRLEVVQLGEVGHHSLKLCWGVKTRGGLDILKKSFSVMLAHFQIKL